MTTTTGRHTIHYRVLNFDLADLEREVAAHATVAEVAQFARDGYLVRERLFQGADLVRLRAALDEVAASEREGSMNSQTLLTPLSSTRSSRRACACPSV